MAESECSKKNLVLETIKAINHHDVSLVKKCIDDGVDYRCGNDYPLRLASKVGNTEIVKLLLEHGADVHACDDDALSSAILNGYVDVVKLILDYGADVNISGAYFNRDIELRHIECVKLILDYRGCDDDEDSLCFLEEESRRIFEEKLIELGGGCVPINPRRLRCV